MSLYFVIVSSLIKRDHTDNPTYSGDDKVHKQYTLMVKLRKVIGNGESKLYDNLEKFCIQVAVIFPTSLIKHEKYAVTQHLDSQ